MKKIVIVEDDDIIAQLLAVYFSEAGFSVDTFASGQELFEEDLAPADLFIIDYSLPGLTGLEIAERIRKQNQLIPLIMISASFQDKQATLNSGIDAFFEKPFQLSELTKTVIELLNRNDLINPLQTRSVA